MSDVLTGTNLEIKARTADLNEHRARLRRLEADRQGVERQEDVYFRVPRGRLKLRRSSRDGAHLIAYLRPDEGRHRESRFHRLPVADPDGLEAALDAMLGSGARVIKTREVWWWRSVRIHLDEVETLGSFVEMEARLDEIGDPDEAAERIERLIEALGIEARRLVDGSYAEAR
ncbi:MAG: class IV adenylate cyclase [Gemmatimonadota bacterium]|nr:class IV adenylate cyclase [Gemmatimonadota bacterium]